MPNLDESMYFVSMLLEVGEARVNGGTLVSIGWQDIESWINVVGADISVGESEVLMRLSSAYVKQYYDSLDVACPSPYMDVPKYAAVESKFKELFSIMRGSRNG